MQTKNTSVPDAGPLVSYHGEAFPCSESRRQLLFGIVNHAMDELCGDFSNTDVALVVFQFH